MTESIVVTGASGLTGYRVIQLLPDSVRAIGFSFARVPSAAVRLWQQGDLRKQAALHAVLDQLRPDVIIHCAARTETDFCEQHPQEAWDLNLGGTENLVQWIARHGGYLLHVSTDLVFDGQKGFYREDDATGPLGVYGHTKLAAESVVRRSRIEACIVRTSLIFGYSPFGNHSVNEKLESEWEKGRVTPLFADEYRCPTAVGELAGMLIEVAQKRIVGILHLAGSQRISRYALGMRIAEILNVPKELLLPRKIAEVKSVPPRARDVSLDISKARALLATPFLALDDGLARELKRRL